MLKLLWLLIVAIAVFLLVVLGLRRLNTRSLCASARGYERNRQ